MPQPWSALFQMNQAFLVELNLDGVSQAMAERAPAGNVNSIVWLLGHILAYRLDTLAALGAPLPASRPAPQTLDELRAAIGATQSALASACAAVEDWTAMRSHPSLPAPMPLEQLVGAFLVHEAYHAGQIAIARKLMGLPGTLKEPKELAHA